MAGPLRPQKAHQPCRPSLGGNTKSTGARSCARPVFPGRWTNSIQPINCEHGAGRGYAPPMRAVERNLFAFTVVPVLLWGLACSSGDTGDSGTADAGGGGAGWSGGAGGEMGNGGTGAANLDGGAVQGGAGGSEVDGGSGRAGADGGVGGTVGAAGAGGMSTTGGSSGEGGGAQGGAAGGDASGMGGGAQGGASVGGAGGTGGMTMGGTGGTPMTDPTATTDDHGFMGHDFVPPAIPRKMRTGVNLSGIKRWSTDSPFIDKFHLANAWLTRPVGDASVWNSRHADKVPKNAAGWPTQVPFDPGNGAGPQIVHTFLSLGENGTYQVQAEGKGTLEIVTTGFARTFALDGTTSMKLDMPILNSKGFLDPQEVYFRILATDAANPIRNISVVNKAESVDHKTRVFTDRFLRRLAPFTDIRFMDWMETNNSHQKDWADRPQPTDYSQTIKGVALEHIIDICNKVKANCWVNVPHLASDEYIRNMAMMFRDRLNPGLVMVAEYSNETWNPQFAQGQYVRAQAPLKFSSDPEWRAPGKFAAFKQAHVWGIFKEVLGNEFDARFRKVIGGQFSTKFTNESRLDALAGADVNPLGLKADGIGVAPYFGKGYDAADWPGDTVPSIDGMLDDAEADLALVKTKMAELKAIADAHNVEIWGIETGQSIKGVAGQSGMDIRERLGFEANLIGANRHDRMYTIYKAYLDALEAGGTTLAMQFSFVAAPNRFGAWGALESLDSRWEKSPKMRAIFEWAARR